MSTCPACHRPFEPPPGSDLPARCRHCGGLVLGPYCDLRWIGGGGMGDVYVGREPEMGDRAVAIKVPRAEMAAAPVQRRFEREIAASARLEHENIVRAYQRGMQSDRPYLVMEYVAGRKLNELIAEQHPLAPRRVARIVTGLARGLEHAEKRGVVNRDLKPENVILAEPDETPKILDYGLGLITDFHEQVTRDGLFLGTPSYAAPEQARDPHAVRIAADVYALGCTAYCCLAGRPPFAATEFNDLAVLHRDAPRPSVRLLRPDVSQDFDALIQWMMTATASYRPTPRQIIDQLERLLPTLSDERPLPPAQGEGDVLRVTCPSCGTLYEINRAQIGKRYQCPNKVCRARFTVTPPRPAAAPDAAAAPGPTIAADEVWDAQLAEGDEVFDAELLDAERLDSALGAARARRVETWPEGVSDHVPAPPLPSETTKTSATSQTPSCDRIETIPMAAVVGETPRRSRRQKRIQRLRRAASAAVVVLLAVSAVLLWWFPIEWGPRPDPQWQTAMETFQEHKWGTARRQLEKFAEDFPADDRVGMIPFFNAMCDAGDDVYSTTGNAARGLAATKKIFHEHRDNRAYQDYSIEIYLALGRLVERLTGEALQSGSVEKLDLAREAATLLVAVAQSRPEEWIGSRNAELLSGIDAAERTIRQRNVRGEVIALLTDAAGPAPSQPVDEIYAAVDRLVLVHPELAGDRELANLRLAAYAAEPKRVSYEPQSDDAPPTVAPDYDQRRQGNTLAVAWGQADAGAADPSAADATPAMALARGVLYVFNAQGQLLWARRLGIDVDRLPQPVPATATSPPALIAVSTEDNTLLSLDAATGRVLWRYQVGQDIAAPLLIVPRKGAAHAAHTPSSDSPGRLGLLPTAEGEIHVIELTLGRRLGRIRVGQPMSVGGTYDPHTELAYFPADARRIFAVDTAALEGHVCPSILFSGHASGALRAPPVCVGPYLILCEASELEHTRLAAYRIRNAVEEGGVRKLGFVAPRDLPLKELRLRGWTWFSPHTAPDRITLVTDQGDLGLFGLNLDYAEEAIYPLVGDAKSPEPAYRLAGRDDARPLAIDAQEHLVWLMEGGRLRKLSVDLLRQKISPLWTDKATEVAGSAAHEAQIDKQGTIYLTTMSASGRVYHAWAVDAESGDVRWQRRLGINVFGDPLLGRDTQGGDRVVLIDDSGRVLGLPPSNTLRPSETPRISQPPGGEPLPAGADDRELTLLGQPPGAVYLAAPMDDRRRLAIQQLDLEPPGANGPRPKPGWTVLNLPGRLAGRPCISGAALVAACDDGQVYRISLANGRPIPGEVSFTWRTNERDTLGPADLYPLGDRAVLLIVGASHVQKLELHGQAGIAQWRRAGEAAVFDPPIDAPPLVVGDRAMLFDRAGMLHAIDLGRRAGRVLGVWPLGLRITAGPVLRGNRVLAVVNQHKLVCLPAAPVGDVLEPLWTSEPFQGRIRGLPSLAGDVLLVADNSRRVYGVSLRDGATLWETPLRVRVGPAAAPAPYGPGKMLVPLADGTLLLAETGEGQNVE